MSRDGHVHARYHTFEGGDDESAQGAPAFYRTTSKPNEPFIVRAFSPMEPGSVRSSMFTLASSAIGAGILSLPLVLKNAGLAFGLLMIVGGALLALFSVKLLVKCYSATSITDYAELVDDVFGSKMASILKAVLVVYTFGACVAYVIVIGKSLHGILSALSITFVSQNMLLTVLTIFVVYPLASMQNLSSLRYATLMSVGAMVYVAIAVFIRGLPSFSLESVEYFRFDFSIFQAATITIFAYTCHVNIFAVLEEFQDPQQRRIRKAIVRSVILEFCLYSFLALFGFLTWKMETEGNIIDNYLANDPLFIIARIAVSIALLVALPLNFNPCRQQLAGLLWPDSEGLSAKEHYGLTAILSFGALGVAIMIPQVSTVFGLLGATCCVFFCYILPIKLYLHLFEHRLSTLRKTTLWIVAISVIIIGTLSVGKSIHDMIYGS